MVKHTQTICRLLSMNCLSVFDHFLALPLEGLTVWKHFFEKIKQKHAFKDVKIYLNELKLSQQGS